MNIGAVIFSAVAMAVVGVLMVVLSRHAERWRAEDPQNREGQVPPVFAQIGKAFMWFILAALGFSALIAVAGPYEDCILQNMKGVQAQAAASAIMRACKEKTTPKKCRDSELGKPRWIENETKAPWKAWATPTAETLAVDRENCLEQCAEASYWSRTFGECSTD